jgi:hypothetical protein
MRKLAEILLLCLIFSTVGARAEDVPKANELIIDQLKKSVVFLQTSWKDTNDLDNEGKPKIKSSVGTGFFIFVVTPELGKTASGDDIGFYFIVTAKHMIRQEDTITKKMGPYADKVTVFFNKLTKIGRIEQKRDQIDFQIIDARGDLEWFVDDSDPITDVAIHPIFITNDENNEVVFKTIGQNLFVTKSLFKEKKFNENDEVLFAGLFLNFYGSQVNFPIVRHGHLALVPGEDISTDNDKPNLKTQIYMAEVTSFGGNSGSPVFLRTGAMREGNTGDPFAINYYLLGVMSGYYPDSEAKQNSGIASIVPAEKINEIISGDRMKAYLARVVAQDKAAKGDIKMSEAKYKESIKILEERAPESSQLVEGLRAYAGMLLQWKREAEAREIQLRADKIANKKISKTMEP